MKSLTEGELASEWRQLLERHYGCRLRFVGADETDPCVAGLPATTSAVRPMRRRCVQHNAIELLVPAVDRDDEPGWLVIHHPPPADDLRFVDECALLARAFPPETSSSAPSSPVRRRYPELIGKSRAMRDLRQVLDRVVGSDSTVLISGENGTGKEVLARAIHRHSSRGAQVFLAQNCSALNDNLLDSELFGHKRGAFTVAVADQGGLFDAADGGTLFLDEIGEMSTSLQVKILRVLQEGTFKRFGDTQPRSVDARILAATNRDLGKMVADGNFREDLYYRVNVIGMTVPPLRERRDDIPLLIEHFLQRAAVRQRRRMKRLSARCLTRLSAYSWPGNVRELENEIERLVVLTGEAEEIDTELLSARIVAPPRAQARPASLVEAVDTVERELILAALVRHRWNKSHAARDLGISRRNLIRKVARYSLAPD